MRGRTKLFEDSIQDADSVSKGRSQKLHSDRNKALIYRYHYYQYHTELRYGAILERLSGEFFISPFTIQERISEQFSMLNELKKKKLTVTDFRKLYPHLNWT